MYYNKSSSCNVVGLKVLKVVVPFVVATILDRTEPKLASEAGVDDIDSFFRGNCLRARHTSSAELLLLPRLKRMEEENRVPQSYAAAGTIQSIPCFTQLNTWKYVVCFSAGALLHNSQCQLVVFAREEKKRVGEKPLFQDQCQPLSVTGIYQLAS